MNFLRIFKVFIASWPNKVYRPPHSQQNLNPWCSSHSLNSEIRLALQLGCLTSRKLLYKSSKSTNISTNIFICTHGGSWVPTTPIIHSKVVHSYTISENIYIVWNIKKWVRGNLISLLSISYAIVSMAQEASTLKVHNNYMPYLEIIIFFNVWFSIANTIDKCLFVFSSKRCLQLCFHLNPSLPKGPKKVLTQSSNLIQSALTFASNVQMQ